MKKMRIAMYVTAAHPIPLKEKKIWAPIEITAQLAEEMKRRGHDVTVFAPKESTLKTKIFSAGLPSLGRSPIARKFDLSKDSEYHRIYDNYFLSQLYQQAQQKKFDVIHIHSVYKALPFLKFTDTPTVATLHDPIEGHRKFGFQIYGRPKNLYYISISNAQRRPLPHLNYLRTIYNGINISDYDFNPEPKDHFVQVGRIVPEKGVHLAVEAAKRAGVGLKIAGEIINKKYWESQVKPALTSKVEYVGLVKKDGMNELYAGAKALLFPIQWEEPFGLVMIEAMASGTPVIAFNRGSVPEIIEHGKTGFIVKNVRDMVAAIKKISTIDRRVCRQQVEKKFTMDRMINDYEQAYREAIKQNR